MSVEGRCLLLSFALSLAACGVDLKKIDLGDLELIEEKPQEPEPEPVELTPDKDGKNPKKAVPGAPKGVVDLGTAIFPEGAPLKSGSAFTFDVPPAHKLTYSLTQEEQAAIAKWYDDYARSVTYKRIGKKTFQWEPPPGCTAGLACVYKALIARTSPDVLVITRRIKQRADAAKLNATQVAQIALAYVQNIPYEIPTDPFGIKPPPLVITERKGDCDSKSLLLYMILNSLGIETIIVSSKSHAHSLAGIALPTTGSSFRWKSRRYAFAETTAKGAPLGYLAPELVSPADWVVELSP